MRLLGWGDENIEEKSGGDGRCDWRGFVRRIIEKNRAECRSGYLRFTRFLGEYFRLCADLLGIIHSG